MCRHFSPKLVCTRGTSRVIIVGVTWGNFYSKDTTSQVPPFSLCVCLWSILRYYHHINFVFYLVDWQMTSTPYVVSLSLTQYSKIPTNCQKVHLFLLFMDPIFLSLKIISQRRHLIVYDRKLLRVGMGKNVYVKIVKPRFGIWTHVKVVKPRFGIWTQWQTLVSFNLRQIHVISHR